MRLPIRAILVAFVCGLLGGCGGAQTLAPVSGVVLYNGKPIENINVSFTPRKGRPAAGASNAGGQFQLRTATENDGAFVGEHVVTIHQLAESPRLTGMSPEMVRGLVSGKRPKPQRQEKDVPSIPAKYHDPASSGLKAVVNKDGGNVFTINIDPDNITISR
ncbi:MAG: hypothetical protein ACT4QC_18305 [Planctomycetaceae bacterium]